MDEGSHETITFACLHQCCACNSWLTYTLSVDIKFKLDCPCAISHCASHHGRLHQHYLTHPTRLHPLYHTPASAAGWSTPTLITYLHLLLAGGGCNERREYRHSARLEAHKGGASGGVSEHYGQCSDAGRDGARGMGGVRQLGENERGRGTSERRRMSLDI